MLIIAVFLLSHQVSAGGNWSWTPPHLLGGVTEEVLGGGAGRQTVHRVLAADKPPPHRADGASALLSRQNSASTQLAAAINGPR